VVIPRGLSRWAEEHVNLSEIDLAHLVRLRAEYTQLAGLIANATIMSRIVIGDGLEAVEDGRIIEIGHELILRGRFLNRTILLIENAANDGRMIQEIFRHEAKRRSFGETSFALSNGGGTSTAGELRRLAEDGNFIVCVCDTDLIVPGGKKSATCNAVLTQSNQITVPGVVALTPGREIENFLPIEVIEALYSANKPPECAVLRELFLRQGDQDSLDCIWLYLDLKCGLHPGKLLEECNTPEKRAWAAVKFNIAEEDLGKIQFSGLGEDILNRYFNSNIAQAIFYKFSRSTYWSKHFSSWIEDLLWGTCGRKELRTG